MKKKQILTWVICLVILLGIPIGMRISSHLRTFGLSKSVLQGEQTPDAEETVRLCLYDVNRGETELANRLMTDECEQYEAKTLPDVKLLDIEPWDSNEEQEQGFRVVYNWRTFWAPWWKDDRTNDIDFQLEPTGEINRHKRKRCAAADG